MKNRLLDGHWAGHQTGAMGNKPNRAAGISKEQLEQHSTESLSLLLETMESINRASELRTLLSESMDAVCTVMRSEASSLMLRDEETGELYVALPKGPVSEQIRGRSIPPDEGIGGWVVQNRKPFLSNAPDRSEPFWGELSPDFKTRNIICVPLFSDSGSVIGVMQALNRREGEFEEADIPVFQALATHVSQAIRRTRQIESLKNEVRDSQLLLRESHHRIKNNLATISALIEMELPQVEDPTAIQALNNTRSRLNSITEVHDMVSRTGEFGRVDLGEYLQALAEKIGFLVSSGKTAFSIDLDIPADRPILISSEKAMYCGMILNELLVNVYKHAFPTESGEAGKVRIELDRGEGERIMLSVADNGSGLPDSFDAGSLDDHRSVGIWVIDVLRKKLDASVEFSNRGGAHITISF